MANEAISTNNTWPNYSAANKATTSAATTELGKDQFLKILITQLQNQDPMQPMEDKEFIAQMAQFSSVEQLVNISSQLKTLNQSLGTVSGMIGREISWLSSNKEDNGTLRKGIVDSIIVRDGVQYAKVGKDEIKLDEIIQVTNPTQAEENENPVQNVEDSAETNETNEQEPSAQPEDNGNTL
ncbi:MULTISPECIES: flagellar hook capping FlgD N-terminal domain-containing protein [unclassified Paenibacillus]|uniref:flagellar hook capping FlgD N-terminal domain-containing protein n=1 Tax=unclassified Paenibacillus TaxID=185978 RepID=UPI0009A872A5|nr:MULTISPECIES: flagellar hook capping FlgD N-terminal domain-containing protein [unclassified Paenibacillus]SLJ97730.1 flagellar basal-body rod modification protein FlgD [Paenibacillus sp. RU5A]SOC66892.1 flagellar basal-body rod modification protein FlgD [Paenibacillus sp. RU26A]SOC69959.1 flagellar basal-body rod modification protein FlgD [Paenibacillus sp. RU5M]